MKSFRGKVIYKGHAEIETFINASFRNLKTILHLIKMK